MSDVTETAFLATRVPQELADEIRLLADESERSTAAEMRLALRAWVEARADREGAAA